jgi:hypothetical protein
MKRCGYLLHQSIDKNSKAWQHILIGEAVSETLHIADKGQGHYETDLWVCLLQDPEF